MVSPPSGHCPGPVMAPCLTPATPCVCNFLSPHAIPSPLMRSLTPATPCVCVCIRCSCRRSQLIRRSSRRTCRSHRCRCRCSRRCSRRCRRPGRCCPTATSTRRGATSKREEAGGGRWGKGAGGRRQGGAGLNVDIVYDGGNNKRSSTGALPIQRRKTCT